MKSRSLVMLGLLALFSAACEKARQDMYDQPRYKPYAASPLFEDGTSARTPPAGTLAQAQGPFAASSSARQGEEDARREARDLQAQRQPYPVDMQLLRRGQQRYSIYCLPCHSPAGDGDGLVARRGFPHPPTYHSQRLRQAPDRHFFDVISNGYGVMLPYADRIEPPDRWAIVAYIRALQLSQHAPVAQLPDDLRQRLEQEGGRR